MNDPKHFEGPHNFNPDRFLDENGKFILNERAVPFGVGKRICLGQTLADKEFYIFCAGILQQFEIAAAPKYKVPSYNFDDSFPTGIIRTVPPYFVVLKNRLRS
jgi:cytochrome P450